MQINTQVLNEKINKLDERIEYYENNYLNYYNKIKEMEKLWSNDKGKLFMQKVSGEEKQSKTICSDLKEINTLYKYIYTSYKDIGMKILVNLEKEEEIFNRINKCIEQNKTILSLYKILDKTNYTPEQKSLIYAEEIKIKKQLETTVKIKESIKDIYKTIKEKESNINKKISKITICIIPENDISLIIES